MKRHAPTYLTSAALLVAAIGITEALNSSPVGKTGTAGTASPTIDDKVYDLLTVMTVEEKLQQLELLSTSQITDADANHGVSSVFSLIDPALIDHHQHIAVEQSRLHTRSCSPTTPFTGSGPYSPFRF